MKGARRPGRVARAWRGAIAFLGRLLPGLRREDAPLCLEQFEGSLRRLLAHFRQADPEAFVMLLVDAVSAGMEEDHLVCIVRDQANSEDAPPAIVVIARGRTLATELRACVDRIDANAKGDYE